jgi:hypothetical protein
MREDRARFAKLRDTRVLIYWPHGFGDWVHFGAVAPMLEPSNVYAITRYGDDYVSVMERNRYVEPLFSGTLLPSSRDEASAPHFGLRLKACNGREVGLQLASPLRESVERFAPQVLLWTDYPETEGRTAYPFHTKARNLIRLLVRKERLERLDLSQTLKCSVDFDATPDVQRIVDERLAPFAEPGTALCVISRSGVTASRKNWGDGTEAREFVGFMRGDARKWRFISMDDAELGEKAASFRTLFAGIDRPFGRVFKALAKRVDCFVGIPAGPLHFVLARGGVPTVGLWLAHHPDWYDEPNADAIHLVGCYVRDRRFDRRPATTTKPAALRHRLRYLDTQTIGSEAVVAAVRELMS